MKELSAMLAAAMSSAATQRGLRLGLTADTGGTSLSLPERQQPLTEKQLMQIASKLLAAPLSISFEKRKIYGKRTERDEHGEYLVDDVTGYEDAQVVAVKIDGQAPPEWFDAALCISPLEALVAHLMRLSVHKRLGSTEQDRAVLIHDYAAALRSFPEFVVYAACKHFWEDNPDPFYPKIALLKEICAEIHAQILNSKPKLEGPKMQPQPIYSCADRRSFGDTPRAQWDRQHYDQAIADAERMIVLATQNPGVLNAVSWRERVAELTAAIASTFPPILTEEAFEAVVG